MGAVLVITNFGHGSGMSNNSTWAEYLLMGYSVRRQVILTLLSDSFPTYKQNPVFVLIG